MVGEIRIESIAIVRILVIILLLFVLPVALLWALSASPVIDLPSSVVALGPATPINVRVSDPHGVRRLAGFVEQNGVRYGMGETVQPARRLLWQRKVADSAWTFTAGTSTMPQLQDGKARLVLEATSNDFRGRTTRYEREVTVVTRPPVLSADSDQHYLYLGMADLATFSISGHWTAAGVRVGDQTYRAWPMPGGKPGMFSLFAFAWNMPSGTVPVVYAADAAGREATSPLVIQFPKKEQPVYTVHTLQVDDRFMQKVVNELDPNGSGDLITRFVTVNSEMRQANNKILFDLRLKTENRFLWSQPFQRQSHSQAESTFADLRNYIYQGQKIDQQVHLGYDLAVTQHVGVEASNDGRVVYAAPLGIYGNCIVVDHGYGLQTIYGHLSQIAVHEGDMVKRGQVMGVSGQTGMAAGDHIHFGMQLEGIQIDPKEWWDPHWIKDHIARRVELPGFDVHAAEVLSAHTAQKHRARRKRI
jgi:murein DD-endopeptidase MepM/ murein hydrolase activator NlpD